MNLLLQPDFEANPVEGPKLLGLLIVLQDLSFEGAFGAYVVHLFLALLALRPELAVGLLRRLSNYSLHQDFSTSKLIDYNFFFFMFCFAFTFLIHRFTLKYI